MHPNLKIFLFLAPIFTLIDLLWLGKIMVGFYKAELGALTRRTGEVLTPVWWAAGLVYLLIPLGIVLFVLPRVPDDASAAGAFGWGLAYGLILYGVYDFTNYSLLDKYPLRMALVDILWGGFICGLATVIALGLRRWLT